MEKFVGRVDKAVHDLFSLAYPIKGLALTSITVPIIDKGEVSAFVCVRDNIKTGKKMVYFQKISDRFQFEAFARLPNNLCRRYNTILKKSELLQPIPTKTGEKIYWSFEESQKSWGRINGLVVGYRLYPFGSPESKAYQKYLDVLMVNLKNSECQDICQIYAINGNLAKLERLAGYDKAMTQAEQYRSHPFVQKGMTAKDSKKDNSSQTCDESVIKKGHIQNILGLKEVEKHDINDGIEKKISNKSGAFSEKEDVCKKAKELFGFDSDERQRTDVSDKQNDRKKIKDFFGMSEQEAAAYDRDCQKMVQEMRDVLGITKGVPCQNRKNLAALHQIQDFFGLQRD